MARTIMVPLDGSTFAEHALPVALGIARSCGGRIHLVQAHELPIVPTSPDVLVPYDARWDAALREQEHTYLTSVANRVAERAGVSARTELLDGAPAMALATYAREMEVDLIVMTTHGRSGLSRVWLGSVADGVVRRSGVPVLLMRPSHDEVDLSEEFQARHVLVPLDGSELSTGVLGPATWLGSLYGARYTLLRVILPVPLLRAPAPMPDNLFAEQLAQQQDAHAREELAVAAGVLRDRGLDVEAAVVSHAVPAAGILEFAASHAVDLIALATHGRGGWSRLALGSVADKVLRGSTLPVMLYRPPVGNDERNAKLEQSAATRTEA